MYEKVSRIFFSRCVINLFFRSILKVILGMVVIGKWLCLWFVWDLNLF